MNGSWKKARLESRFSLIPILMGPRIPQTSDHQVRSVFGHSKNPAGGLREQRTHLLIGAGSLFGRRAEIN